VTTRWAYLGPQGTFCEQAARNMVAQDTADGREPDVELRPATGVSDAIGAVRAGRVAAAVVPLENSVEGGVALTQDELTHGDPVVITAEAFVPVTFDLLVRPGTPLSGIGTVGSHPHGHAQVRGWLATNLPDARIVETASTAAAAAMVAAGELDAAAGAPVAGERYRLAAVATDIGERRDAVTRFVRLSVPAASPPPTGNDRTSLVLSVANTPGSLLAVLTEFAVRGINLTRLESRPTRELLGEYVFLVDADGHVADQAMADTLTALIRRGELRRFLGSYPRSSGEAVRPPDFAADGTYAAARLAVESIAGTGRQP